jgi:uncharacterized protein
MSASFDRFAAWAVRIPTHGIGLSVDVHSPDLLDVHRALERAGTLPDYLEIFKAPTRDLARIRAALPGMPLAYHAEGLWLTESDLQHRYPWAGAIDTIARHAETIGADWVNHECASKQFGGYSFGTYLSPLFTHAAADATAANAALAQAALDDWYARRGRLDAAPLLLLELPPLTYCAFGDLPVQEFFARIVEQASCGLMLDIGHLWTHWRYHERRRFPTAEAFAADFLETFPLNRVVQVHLAGLGMADGEGSSEALPCWIDKHDAPVPGMLFDLLRQVLAHPGLTALKGIALEVDTKAIPLIVEEFAQLRGEPTCQDAFHHTLRLEQAGKDWSPIYSVIQRADEDLVQQYAAYARVVSGQETLEASPLAPFARSVDRDGLVRYTSRYLPQEILRWGGDLTELFPSAWTALEKRGITGADFVRFWFSRPRPITEQYDFFYIKLDRWVEFIGETASDLAEQVKKDAAVLRSLHAELNDEATVVESNA